MVGRSCWGNQILSRRRKKSNRRECEVCPQKIYSNNLNIIYCSDHQCKILGCQEPATIYNYCFDHRIGAKYICTLCGKRFINRLNTQCHINSQIACSRCYTLMVNIAGTHTPYEIHKSTASIMYKLCNMEFL